VRAPGQSFLRSLWRLLERDPVIWVSTVVFGLALVVLVGQRSELGDLASRAALFVDPALLVAILVVLLWGRNRLGTRRERQFWDLIALAWGCWLVVEFLYFSGLSLPLLSASFATDALYILYYLILALAVDLRPHIEPARSLTMLRRRLASVAGLVSFFGLLIYFALVVLPDPLGLSLSFVSRAQGLTPFLLLRLCLDLLTLGRLLYAALTSSGRWPGLYGTLAAALLLLAVKDGVALVQYEGILTVESFGTGYDVLLLLPGFLVVLAARLRFRPASESPEISGGALPAEEREVSRFSLLAVYSLLVPIVHFLLYPLGLLEPESRVAREVFGLVYVLVVGSIAVAHQLALDRERRQAVESLHREIEKRKRINRKLELRQAEMEQFNHTVSHELQTPLVTIGGFVGLLENELAEQDNENLKRDLARIREATSHMRRVLRQLLELSRVGWLVKPVGDVAMGSVLEQARSQLEVKTGPRKPRIVIETGLPVVRADPARMLDVLVNLIDNAVKFTPSDQRPEIRIGCRPGQEPAFYIADKGRGIDPRFHSRVFGLFDRLDPTVEGTGIGLALVKRIIEEHGGRIWVESAGIGHGSTFHFTLGRQATEQAEATLSG
jgi:signal transduction histidine kinase